MAVIANGTQASVVGSKHSLHTTSSNGVFALMVDTSAMVNGDKLEIYIDVGFVSGAAHIQTHYSIFAHAQDDPGKVSVPVVAPFGATFSIKQTAGTSRSFPWCIVAA